MSIKSEFKTHIEHTNSYVYKCNDAQSKKILSFEYEAQLHWTTWTVEHNFIQHFY